MNHESLVLSNELIKVELRGAIRYPGLDGAQTWVLRKPRPTKTKT